MSKTYTVTPETSRQRADSFVASFYPQFARSAVHKLFELGHVVMDDQPLKAGYRVREGDSITIDDDLLVSEPAGIDLPIIYEDDDVVVINKPSGVLSHNRGSFSPEATVASWLRHRTHTLVAGAGNRAGIVHRLDRATSGVMICAKNEQSQSWLQKQFSLRNVVKTYTALVEGQLPSEQGIIDMPLMRNPAKPQTFITHTEGKHAITKYVAVRQSAHFSELSLTPETGRTHQLRVHLAALGHPIVNDSLYGHGTPLRALAPGEVPDGPPPVPDDQRLMLHAHRLEITLPSGERKTFTAPVPSLFAQKLKQDA